MTALLGTTVFVALLAVAAAQCGGSCEFFFCDGIDSFEIGPGFTAEDVAFTGAICKDGLEVGHVDATGEALVAQDSGLVPISQYSPAGLLQNFSPSTFKSFTVFTKEFEASGVGHECPQTNGYRYLDGLCIVLPIFAYQQLNEFGQVIANFAPRTDEACIAFEVTVPNADAGPLTVLTEVPAPTELPLAPPSGLGICQECNADSECAVNFCESYVLGSPAFCGERLSQVAAGCLVLDGVGPVATATPGNMEGTSDPGSGVGSGEITPTPSPTNGSGGDGAMPITSVVPLASAGPTLSPGDVGGVGAGSGDASPSPTNFPGEGSDIVTPTPVGPPGSGAGGVGAGSGDASPSVTNFPGEGSDIVTPTPIGPPGSGADFPTFTPFPDSGEGSGILTPTPLLP